MKIQTSIKLGSFPLQFISLISIIMIFSITINAQTTEQINFLEEGNTIPEFTIDYVNGKTISSSTLKGKVIVLCFFATWCGPCMKELPHVQKEIWEEYKTNPNFELLAIGREHTRDEMATFKKTKNFTFPIIADTNRSIFSKFAKQNIPRMYLIDQTGKIIFMTEGFDEKTFKALIKKLDAELKK